MGILKMHKAIFILPFLIAGLKHVHGSPDPNPLVSSSGMMPMKPKNEPSLNTTAADSGSKPFSILRPFPDGRVSVVSKQASNKNALEPENAVQPTINPQTPGILNPTQTLPPLQLPKEISQQEVENKRKAEVLETVIISESLKEIDNKNHSALGLPPKPSASGKRQLKPEDEEDEVFFETLKNQFDEVGKPNDAAAADGKLNPAFQSLNVGFDEEKNYTGGSGSNGEPNTEFQSLNVGFDEEKNYTSGGDGDGSGGSQVAGGNGQVGGGGGDNEVEVGADPYNEEMDIGINITNEVSTNLDDDPLPYGRYLTYKLGPPWEDPMVVGSLPEQAVVELVEIR
ncbi:unnamed protein product [Orchesella dallaii]|uniref:Uncharacterized protein n=1 Tax=Orchesella dallaii TaxID=48710 RepID=A0ABP1QKS3_9HEXA